LTIAELSARGYVQYEISNYAKSPKKKSRHNSKYWSFVPYLGLGPSSHTFIPPKRHWNHADVHRYTEDVFSGIRPIAGKETLGREQQITEAIYLGLRQTVGIDIHRFNERFGVDFSVGYRETIHALDSEGLISFAENRCALTRKGMLYLDSIAAMFLLTR